MAGPDFWDGRPPKAGDPVAMRGLARTLNRITHALRHLSIHNGYVTWHGYEPKIITEQSSGSLPAATTQYKVMAVNSSIEWEEDWVRWP